MSSIVKVTDKRSGLTYAYENFPYWDKEKKDPRNRRRLIGRVDPVTGEIVPTDGRRRKKMEAAAEEEKKKAMSSPSESNVQNSSKELINACILECIEAFKTITSNLEKILNSLN